MDDCDIGVGIYISCFGIWVIFIFISCAGIWVVCSYVLCVGIRVVGLDIGGW